MKLFGICGFVDLASVLNDFRTVFTAAREELKVISKAFLYDHNARCFAAGRIANETANLQGLQI